MSKRRRSSAGACAREILKVAAFREGRNGFSVARPESISAHNGKKSILRDKRLPLVAFIEIFSGIRSILAERELDGAVVHSWERTTRAFSRLDEGIGSRCSRNLTGNAKLTDENESFPDRIPGWLSRTWRIPPSLTRRRDKSDGQDPDERDTVKFSGIRNRACPARKRQRRSDECRSSRSINIHKPDLKLLVRARAMNPRTDRELEL